MAGTGSVSLSVVIPVHNESGVLEETVEELLESLEGLGNSSFEIILSEDGSRDSSPEIARQLATRHECVKSIHSDSRLGKGEAVSRGFRQARGDILLFVDADLATDLQHLQHLIGPIEEGEAEIAIGCRYGSKDVERPIHRDIASRAYNWSVRKLLASDFHDHQCGFKAFERRAFESLDPSVTEKGFFWDTEILLEAQSLGFEVVEVPVSWKASKDSKVRLSRDSVYFGRKIIGAVWERKIWQG